MTKIQNLKQGLRYQVHKLHSPSINSFGHYNFEFGICLEFGACILIISL
jgi:hypothetical protein